MKYVVSFSVDILNNASELLFKISKKNSCEIKYFLRDYKASVGELNAASSRSLTRYLLN